MLRRVERKDDADDAPTAAAVLVLHDGKLLCGVRSDNDQICGPGGHIEDGEAPIQTAIRETQEEFGITPVDLMYMGTQGENGENTHCTAVYLCTSFSGTPQADGKEMHGAFFLSPEKLVEQFGDHLFPPFADSLKMPKPAQIMQTLSMDISDGCGIIGHEDKKPFDESEHPRGKGQRFVKKGSSTSHGQNKRESNGGKLRFIGPKGKIVEVKHDPEQYSNVSFGVSENSGHVVGDFKTDKRDPHIQKHAAEMGLSEREYRRKAHDFLSKPMTESMEEIVVSGKPGSGRRKIYRYDYATNEYGVINSHDNAGTYYYLDRGSEDWEHIIETEGKGK